MATRLPVQHPNAPHCLDCKADLPTFDGVTLLRPADSLGVELLEIIFRVRCKCGAEWMLKKKAQ